MFNEKLNIKIDGMHSIEEEITMVDGKWEGELKHSNIIIESLTIYTGEKLTGDKVENYYLSTSEEATWRTSLKVFSDSEKVYVSYETPGDQIDARDINRLQVKTKEVIDDLLGYRTQNDDAVDGLDNRTTNLEDTRATKTYVDTELNKKYDKDQVFTKEEVLQKVKGLIGAAPDALDTLEKLANALDNDPTFATTVINLLAEKVDKVDGKGLSDENYSLVEKSKLASIEANANKYIHPATHSANIIVENAEKRFVSDVEKTKWNTVDNKVDKEPGKGLSTNNYSDEEKARLAKEIDEAGSDNVTPTSITLGNYKIVFNEVENSLDFEVIE